MLVSCCNAKKNDDFNCWCQDKHGSYEDVKYKCCLRHNFLGMTRDFESTPDAVHVIQKKHGREMIEGFPNKSKGNSPSPAGKDLFSEGANGFLSSDRRERFHTIVGQGLL